MDIVIPIWNQPVLTRRCLESILRGTELPVRLILVDNGSSLETQAALERFEPSSPRFQVHRIRNSSNLGFIKAVNQGIRAGSAPWVCILNNDTVVTPGWLEEMLKVAAADPKIGLVNPTSNSLGFRPGQVPLDSYADGLRAYSGQSAELSTALGFCLFARRSLLESVGLLDESFGMGYFDDDDLSRRVKAAGYRCVRASASYVFHEERVSFRLLPKNRSAFEKNRRLFEQRWGRRLRILWAMDRQAPAPLILELAAQGHWLTLVDPKGAVPGEVLAHAQVSRLNAGNGGWRLPATLRLLLKRKKPFDLVISPDPSWSRWVKRLRWLHRARLLSGAGKEEILQQCRTLSRSPL
ncbi:MAG: glycosyltransferase family 2 protein [Candidatus Omnitrophica bacterium]|nr:glycosyltransferase family 2 protein [Candidatus Omnitrophota bacterium]